MDTQKGTFAVKVQAPVTFCAGGLALHARGRGLLSSYVLLRAPAPLCSPACAQQYSLPGTGRRLCPHQLLVQVGMAQMLKGGVIMDVVTPEEARIAE